MTQPRISRLDTWARMERRIHTILLDALELMSQEHELPEGELEISRRLFDCLRKTHYTLMQYDDAMKALQVWYEANNQPSLEDKERRLREDKRPDFQYGFHDDEQPDYRLSQRQYVIECKRLGKATISGWVLTENYVKKGVQRFISEDHGYGKDTRSGTMIGYVQNMGLDEILSEVNATASQNIITHSNPPISRSSDWQENGTSWLISEFDRPFPESPFVLHHLWVDLRTSYLYPVISDNEETELDSDFLE